MSAPRAIIDQSPLTITPSLTSSFSADLNPVNWTQASRFNDIDINPKHFERGIYFIYGWLEVGKVIDKVVKKYRMWGENSNSSM